MCEAEIDSSIIKGKVLVLNAEAPRMRPSKWREKTCLNNVSEALKDAEVCEHPFRSYLPDPCAPVGIQARYGCIPQGKNRVYRVHGGKRHNLLRWARLLLDGIQKDDLELIDDALAAPLSKSTELVSGGGCGAALSYGGEAVLSQALVQNQTIVMIQEARAMAQQCRRHYSDSEWKVIETRLKTKAKIWTDQAILFQDVKIGDSALHLAVRHGALRAAKVLLDRGFDPLPRNSSGESIISLLSQIADGHFKEAEAYIFHLSQLNLTKGERERHRKNFDQTQAIRLNAMHDLALTLGNRLEDHDKNVLEPLAHRAWRGSIEGTLLSQAEQALLNTRDQLRADLKLADLLRKKTTPSSNKDNTHLKSLNVRALYTLENFIADDNTSVEERDFDNASLATLDFDHVDIDAWLNDLDRAALLIQSVWRGYLTRLLLVKQVSTVSIIQIQAGCRTLLAAKRRKTLEETRRSSSLKPRHK